MFKFAVVILALIACAVAKPGLIGAPVLYSASIVAAAAPVVTATSSQYVARNHNGIVSASVVAPVAPRVFAKTVAAYTAPIATPLAYSAPLIYSTGPAPVFL